MTKHKFLPYVLLLIGLSFTNMIEAKDYLSAYQSIKSSRTTNEILVSSAPQQIQIYTDANSVIKDLVYNSKVNILYSPFK